MGDERRVVQVLYNLLANAVGFSPQDATVGLSAKRTEHTVIFSVTDSGPASRRLKDKVFDWFEIIPTVGTVAPASAVAGALLRRTARRQGARRFHRRQRHDRHVRLSIDQAGIERRE